MQRGAGATLFLAILATLLVVNAMVQVESLSQLAAVQQQEKKDEQKPTQKFFAVGDSIAQGLINIGMDGVAQTGWGTDRVLGLVQGVSGDKIKDKTVMLSSGASNSPTEGAIRSYVPQQIQALKAKGASVILLGVGSKFSHLNATLQSVAQENGARFSALTKTSDGVHPDYRELLSSVGGNTNKDEVPRPQVQGPPNITQQQPPPQNVPQQPLPQSQNPLSTGAFSQPQSVPAVSTAAQTPFPDFAAKQPTSTKETSAVQELTDALSEGTSVVLNPISSLLKVPSFADATHTTVPPQVQPAGSFTSPDLAGSKPYAGGGSLIGTMLANMEGMLREAIRRLERILPF